MGPQGSTTEKFLGTVTFRVMISQDFKINSRSGRDLANNPFADRVFGALPRALGLIVRSALENHVLGDG